MEIVRFGTRRLPLSSFQRPATVPVDHGQPLRTSARCGRLFPFFFFGREIVHRVCVCVCVCWLTRCFLLRRNCATAASIYRAMRPRSVGRVTEALDFTGQRFFFSPTDKISSSANTAITRVFHFVRAPAAERKSHSRRQTHVGAPLG